MTTYDSPNNLTYGRDTAGANAYVEIIASPRGLGTFENKKYTNLIVWCETQDAIISIDGGGSDGIYVKAGKEPMQLNGLEIIKAVQAKNAAGGSNYANLVCIVW